MRLAALYVRVSTEEQAMRGYSIEAQRDALRQYAKDNDYFIVQEYTDEGVSGKKPYHKRPALSQFMSDIQGGMNVDVLLFCKLDRFYRSVKLYYQAVEILDRCGVAWKAILENYETETANGRFTVNVMLSVAENEADRTSERIKFVFENKIANGQAITGKSPLGYRIVNHQYIIDPETSEIARALFREYLARQSASAALRYVHETYGVSMRLQTVFNTLRNRRYIGEYRGNSNFCPALISEAEFKQVQELLVSRGIRHNQSGQVYIFSGLLKCGCCGRRLAGVRTVRRPVTKDPVTYIYYKCNAYHMRPGSCTRTNRIREDMVEDWLLHNVAAELEAQRVESEARATAKGKKQKGPDRAAILRKLDRLKNLYINELIDLDQYRVDYDQYTRQLAEINAACANQPVTPDYRGIQEKISGIEDFYGALDTKERQVFWHGLIREIRVELDDSMQIFFK